MNYHLLRWVMRLLHVDQINGPPHPPIGSESQECGGEYEDSTNLPWTKIEISHGAFWQISE